jgi:hypothetical protein
MDLILAITTLSIAATLLTVILALVSMMLDVVGWYISNKTEAQKLPHAPTTSSMFYDGPEWAIDYDRPETERK